MYEGLEISRVAETGSVPVLNLQGRLDASGAQLLRERCLALREEGSLTLVIDLTGVSFVASSGLGTFLLLTEEFANAGGKVIFAAPCESVQRVISLLNLDKFLEIERSVDAALTTVEV